MGMRTLLGFTIGQNMRGSINAFTERRKEDGISYTNIEDIECIVVDFFRSLFSSTCPTNFDIDHVSHEVTQAVKDLLERPYKTKEVEILGSKCILGKALNLTI